MAAEDIAARFGVTAAVVRQRLKRGAVSPKLRALYRKGDMNLDQLIRLCHHRGSRAAGAGVEGITALQS